MGVVEARNVRGTCAEYRPSARHHPRPSHSAIWDVAALLAQIAGFCRRASSPIASGSGPNLYFTGPPQRRHSNCLSGKSKSIWGANFPQMQWSPGTMRREHEQEHPAAQRLHSESLNRVREGQFSDHFTDQLCLALQRACVRTPTFYADALAGNKVRVNQFIV